jgi:hypothetical protein
LGDGGPWESPKTKTKYTAGGYVEDLPVDSLQDALDAVDVLEQNDWIDEATRIILIDISVYNPNVDQFAFIRLAAERLVSQTDTVEKMWMVPVSCFMHECQRIWLYWYHQLTGSWHCNH